VIEIAPLDVVIVILPVFLLIFVGYVTRASGFLDRGFWDPAERLIYFVLFPALLLVATSEANLAGLDIPRMAGLLIACILAIALLTLLLRPLMGLDGPGFTSVFQGVVRQNTYIGLALAGGLFGGAGLAAAGLAVAAIIPVINLLSILALARYGSAAQPTLTGTLGLLARNPLILACALGILLNATGTGLPPIAGDMLKILSAAALPLGLLAVGAGLDLAAARTSLRPVALASGLRLVVLPALTVLACKLVGLAGIAAAVAVLFNSTPSAPNAYILARLLGGDARLMAGILTIETALAMVTVPLVLVLAF